jgi:hypothetical protein
MNNFNELCFAAPSVRRAAPVRRSVLSRLAQWLGSALQVRSGTPSLSEADRLAAVQGYLSREFRGCWDRMSPRDQHLYRMLVRAPSIRLVQALRFECFDLMCRLLGEGAARERQPQIDGWLMPRR